MRAMPDQPAPALAQLLAKRAYDDGAVPPADAQYELLMAKAQRMFAAGKAPTIEQAFAKLYSGKPVPEDEDETDDGDDPSGGSAGSGVDFDDDDDVDMSLGAHPADTGAGRVNRGRSVGTYQHEGNNVAQNARGAAVGAVEGSYSPARRPASASRTSPPPGVSVSQGSDPRVSKQFANPSRRWLAAWRKRKRDRKVTKRLEKFFALCPQATAQDGVHYVSAPTKADRRAIIAKMRGAA